MVALVTAGAMALVTGNDTNRAGRLEAHESMITEISLLGQSGQIGGDLRGRAVVEHGRALELKHRGD